MRKKLSAVFFIVIVFAINVSTASQLVSLPAIDAHMIIKDGWLFVTRDMETINLKGTDFNYQGADEVFATLLSYLKQPKHENVQAVVYVRPDNTHVFEHQIVSQEDSETNRVWDISLYQDLSELNTSEAEIIDIYTTSHGDFFFATRHEKVGTEGIVYATVNNGRCVLISCIYDEYTSTDQAIKHMHGFLDTIEFTKKEAKPVRSSTLSDSTKGSFFDDISVLFVKFFTFNLSSYAVVFIVAGIVCVCSGIWKVILKLKKRQ